MQRRRGSPQITQADGILTARIQRAIEHYVDCRDIAQAASLAQMDRDELVLAMKRKEVKDEVQRKIEIVDRAMAELRVKARVLTPDKLDAKLAEMLDAKGKATPASAKVKALEIGYKRFGMLTEKSDVSSGGKPIAFEIVRVGQKAVGA